MKNTPRLFLIMALFMFTLSACGLLNGGDDLAGTSWYLTSYRKTVPLEGSSITLNFDKDSLGGNGGCNSYGGDYNVRGEKLVISNVYSTEMYCEANGVMDQEAQYYKLLSEVESFSIAGTTLTLTTSSGETLVFEATTY